jgi:hypothetical protein
MTTTARLKPVRSAGAVLLSQEVRMTGAFRETSELNRKEVMFRWFMPRQNRELSVRLKLSGFRDLIVVSVF